MSTFKHSDTPWIYKYVWTINLVTFKSFKKFECNTIKRICDTIWNLYLESSKLINEPIVVAHTFRHSTHEAETGKQLLSLRPDWLTKWVTQQPILYRENPSQKQNEELTKEKKNRVKENRNFCMCIDCLCVYPYSESWRFIFNNDLTHLVIYMSFQNYIFLLLIIVTKLKQKLFSSWKCLDT